MFVPALDRGGAAGGWAWHRGLARLTGESKARIG
jgi:hypothetical protein